MQTSPAKVATLPAPAPADPEPSLGDVRFDEWFATPVFESDVDERLEELAMSRRGPLALAASTLLRVNARTERAKGRRSRRQQPTEDFYSSALCASRRKPPVQTVPVEAVSAEIPVVELPAVEPVADRSPVPDLSAGPSPRPGIRARMSSALDRWAEKEAQSQERLERLLLPRRWQS